MYIHFQEVLWYNGFMEKIRRSEKFHRLIPFIIFIVGYLIWFEVLEHVTRTNVMLIGWPVDKKIPFLECFILPYDSWFIFLPFGILVLLIQDEEAYDRLITFLMIGMLAFLVISTVWPNRLDLRPETLPRDNIFSRMILSLWAADTPENVWPSIHVFDTAAIELMLLISHANWMKKKWVRIATMVWAVLIIVGTLFIKQHSLFDHLTAWLMLGILSFLILKCGMVFRFDRKRRSRV